MPSNNPNVKANLKPFKAGKDERRNTKGRPPKLPALDVLLDEVLGKEDKDGITAAQKILAKLEQQATTGNVRAAEILLDRAYGKAKQQTDITSNGESINIPPIKWVQ